MVQKMTYSKYEYDSRLEEGDLSAAEELAAYVEAKEQLETAEARVKLQGEVVYEILSCEPDNKIEFGEHAFSLQSRTKWGYSDNVTNLAAELSALKKLEQANGLAKNTGASTYPVLKRLT